jgi:hypothetical protein
VTTLVQEDMPTTAQANTLSKSSAIFWIDSSTTWLILWNLSVRLCQRPRKTMVHCLRSDCKSLQLFNDHAV